MKYFHFKIDLNIYQRKMQNHVQTDIQRSSILFFGVRSISTKMEWFEELGSKLLGI